MRRGKTVTLVNRQPQWKPSLNGYCLSFKGRVKEPSIKNFQLVDEEKPLDLVMQVDHPPAAPFLLLPRRALAAPRLLSCPPEHASENLQEPVSELLGYLLFIAQR